jgi:glycine hydroxymethyltransferase
MNLSHGGHLTHGHPLSFSGKEYKVVAYGVRREDERIDYDELAAVAREHRPGLIIAGASAYSREIDFRRFAEVAEEVGAVLMADIAHIAGLVVAGEHPDPVPIYDFVTGTTHKTLRGPRGGFILAKAKYADAVDRGVFPGMQGGPLEHVIAAKAVAFRQAMSPEFRRDAEQTVANAKALAAGLVEAGAAVVTGGTDNHLMLVDVRPLGVTGKEADLALGEVRITVNRNTIPYDPNPPMVASGIRVGTPAVTGRGMKEAEMGLVAQLIVDGIAARGDEAAQAAIRDRVAQIVDRFPVPGLPGTLVAGQATA